MSRLPAALLVLLAACAPGASQRRIDTDALATRVDSVFSHLRADGPGCAVGVYRDGKAVLTRSYGLANVEENRPITPRTTFNLGSVAKAFTALAILTLADERRLSLDDDVRRYVPELPDYGTPIRIRDLLQHSSGFRDYGTIVELTGRELRTMPELVSLLASQRGLNFTPGSRHEYSHSDYMVLGVIIERVTGGPFGVYLEQSIFPSLNMKGARVTDGRAVPMPGRAFGHHSGARAHALIDPVDVLVGGSNVFASIEDMGGWDSTLAAAGRGDERVARMLTLPTLATGDTVPYAWGIRRLTYRGLPTLERGGHDDGMRVEYIRFPEQGVAVVTMCNAEDLYAGALARRVAAIYLGDAMQPLPPVPDTGAPVPLTVAELQRYVGMYRMPDSQDIIRFTILDGKLAELLPSDTAQTFTYRGEGEFTGDGSPGDFRTRFRDGTNGMLLVEAISEGTVLAAAERTPEAEVWRPDAAALGAYEGIWVNADLGVAWQLVTIDGALVLRRPGNRDVPLIPVQRDLFMHGFGFWAEPVVARFAFERNAAGRVTQFTLSTPAGADVVRGLRFTRFAP